MRSAAGILLLVVSVCVPTGCTDALGILDNSSHDGELKTATFEIAISPSVAAEYTRAGGGEPAWDDDKVKHVWVGVFTEAGKLIGSERWNIQEDHWKPTTGNGSEEHAPMLQEPVRVSVMYSDKNRPRVKVVGVANYEGIKAYKFSQDGEEEESTMDELLARVETWDDYLAISIDTKSADDMAIQNGCRIMSNIVTFDGYKYNKDKEGKITGVESKRSNHYNFTVNSDGTINTADGKTDSSPYFFDELDENSKFPIKGHLHLRRVVSHNIVNITVGDNVELSDIQYKFCNLPQRTYIQDRTLTENAAAEWNDSPNAADYNNNASYGETDFMPVEDGKTTFEFSHYDNKHWGLSSCTEYGQREVRNSDNSFASLCLSESNFNNNASYFVIRAHVREKNTGLGGVVDYVIHEGYCNDSYGRKSDNNARDFSCFRNTKYTYNVQITGLNSLGLKVTSDNPQDNPAVEGEITSIKYELGADLTGNKTMTWQLTDNQRKSLKWRIYTPDPNGKADFGTFSQDMFAGMEEKYPNDWRNTDGYSGDIIDEENDFYKAIKFCDESEDEYAINDFCTPNPSRVTRSDDHILNSYTVKIDDGAVYSCVANINEKENMARIFYCYPSDDSYANSAGNKYQPLFIIKQYPKVPKLTQPEIQTPLFANSISTFSPVAVANYAKSVNVSLTKLSHIENDENELADEYSVSVDANKAVRGNGSDNDWTFEVPSGLAAGVHTLHLTASRSAEDADASTPVDEKFYVYPTKMTWDFSKIALLAGGSISGNAAFSADSYYGLAVSSGFTVGTNYLQTGGTSNADTRSLKFTALYDGIVTVKVSNTGNKEAPERNVAVRNNDKVQQEYGGVKNTTPVERKFNVKKGEVAIYQIGGSLNFYSVTIEYENIWNFSANAWADVITSLKNAGSTGIQTALEVDGFHYKPGTGTNSLRAGDNYIMLNGTGNHAGNCFWFEVEASGKLTLTASNTGSNNDSRQVAVQVGENEAITQGNLNNTTQVKFTFDVEIDKNATEPTKVYIYSPKGGGLRFYDKIEYKPTY